MRETAQSIGKLGEDLAVRFLGNKGFVIIERNYLKPYGEIDVVCLKEDVVHFVEVKSVSRLTSNKTLDEFRPEDNIHSKKLKRLSRVFEVYISEKNIMLDWQFDVVTVIIDKLAKTANITLVSDIVIGS